MNEIIIYSNEKLNTFLKVEIKSQFEYIEMKTTDYPFLYEKGKEVITLNNKINSLNFNKGIFEMKNITKFRDSLNTNYNLNLEFIKIEKCNDSIKKNILENDLLIINYLVNKNYIEKHCNIVE